MDFTLREWLLIIGALLILGVLIDGYRRARNNKKGSLKLAIDKNLKFRDDERVDYFNGELPNGSARTVLRSQGENAAEAAAVAQSSNDDVTDEELTPEPLYVDDAQSDPSEQTPASDVNAIAAEPDPLFDDAIGDHGDIVESAPQSEPVAKPAANQASNRTEEPADDAEKVVDEVVVINAFAPEDKPFGGTELMEVILACGMRYGDLQIFHRHEKRDDASAVQFSMANALKPGFFDLDDIDNFSTPGVSFFMSMPGPSKSMQAFDYMLETAQCVVKNLGGELRDEQHSTLTSQTIEHARQKIRDYERRQLSLLQ